MKRLTLKKWILTNFILLLIFLVITIISLRVGPSKIDFRDILNIILGDISYNEISYSILIKVRLPRIILAAFVGAALSVSGVVLQAILHNPLSEPYISGISGGAAIGGILAILFNLDNFLPYFSVIPLCSFLSSIITTSILYIIFNNYFKMSTIAIILLGVIVNTFSSAVILFITSIIDSNKLQQIIFWLIGNISSVEFHTLLFIGIFLLIGIIMLYYISYDLNIINLGEEIAVQTGVEVNRIKKIAFLASSILTGSVISISGMIGFIGLAVPHILRFIIGYDHRLLIPASAISGAIFLIISDTIARTIIAPSEIPVGVITALIGCPIFIWLLIRNLNKNNIV